MDKLERVLEKVRSGQNNELNAEDTNVFAQLIVGAQKTITKKLVAPKARKMKTRRYDLVDEVNAARIESKLTTLKAAQDKRVKQKTREHDTARDVRNAWFADNSTDINFVEQLRKSLGETGRLEKPLTRL